MGYKFKRRKTQLNLNTLEKDNDLLKYIPQRSPFILVDKLFKTSEKEITTGFTVPDSHVMVTDGVLNEGGMIENIAQSAAMHIGYECIHQNKKVPLGYIASIKNLKIFQQPKCGDELVTEIKVLNEVMQMNIVSGIIKINNQPIAECELRVFINED